MREMGPTVARLPIYLSPARRENPALIRADGSYDWSRVDADIATVLAAGFKILANPMWLPRLWTGGLPVNEPYASSAWVDPTDGSKGRRSLTREEAPYLFAPNHPPIHFEAIFAFGVAFAQRHGKNIRYISWWNEPDGFDFYPQKEGPYGYLESMAIPLYYEYAAFIAGWRSVCPETLIVGPDCSSPGCLDLFLKLEERAAEKPTRLTGIMWYPPHPFDILGIHCYGPRPYSIEGSLNDISREGGYADVLRRHGILSEQGTTTRPVWNTECCDGGTNPVEHLSAINHAFPWISGNVFYNSAQFIEGGARAWDAERFVPNELYREMQAYIAGEPRPSHRRAVRS